MRDSLKAFLDSRGAKPVDPTVIAEYERTMREECIPAIEKAMRENAKRVAQVRHKVLF